MLMYLFFLFSFFFFVHVRLVIFVNVFIYTSMFDFDFLTTNKLIHNLYCVFSTYLMCKHYFRETLWIELFSIKSLSFVHTIHELIVVEFNMRIQICRMCDIILFNIVSKNYLKVSVQVLSICLYTKKMHLRTCRLNAQITWESFFQHYRTIRKYFQSVIQIYSTQSGIFWFSF